jgi:ATP-dependent helicase/nuclease subunit A
MLHLIGTVPDAAKAIENYETADAGNRKMTSCFMDMVAPTFIEKGLEYNVYGRRDVLLGTAKSDSFRDGFRSMMAEGGKPKPVSETERIIEFRLSYEYPDKKALLAKSKYSVSDLGRTGVGTVRDKASAIPLFLQGAKKPTAAMIGTAIHTVMENLDFKEAAHAFESGGNEGRDYLRELVKELDKKEILALGVAELIDIGQIEMFIKSDIGKRAAKADNIYKETPFNIIKEIDGIEAIIQGIIDCYFEEGGEYVLLDYKSDHITGDESIGRVKEMYANQIKLYGEAIETVKNIRVKEKYLYLFNAGAAFLIN